MVKEVFKRLRKNNLKVDLKKIQFSQKGVKLLGVTVNGKGKKLLELKRNEALEYPKPNTMEELRRFLGLAN